MGGGLARRRLDHGPGRQLLRKFPKNKTTIQQTQRFNTIYLSIAFHFKNRILPDKMTSVSFPIVMNYTLGVSIRDVKRLIDVK